MENKHIRVWCLICAIIFFLQDIIGILKKGNQNLELFQIGCILYIGYGIMKHLEKDKK